MRKLLLFVAIIVTLSSADCENTERNKADHDLQIKTDQAMAEANSQIGMPAIKNFQERKLAKMIFELRDQENLVCYAYIVNQYKGELVFIGKCIGYGLPYSVQYTNPEKSLGDGGYSGMSHTVLPQADPNGLFMPVGLSATWLMMVDDKGNPHPVYLEPEIVVSPFPLHK